MGFDSQTDSQDSQSSLLSTLLRIRDSAAMPITNGLEQAKPIRRDDARVSGAYNGLLHTSLRCPMSSVLAEIKEKAAQLSETERAELALALIESLDGPAESDAEVEEAWRIEIERRVAQVEQGEVELIPGDEVIRRVRRRLG